MTAVSYKYNNTVPLVESTIIHCTVDGTRMNEKNWQQRNATYRNWWAREVPNVALYTAVGKLLFQSCSHIIFIHCRLSTQWLGLPQWIMINMCCAWTCTSCSALTVSLILMFAPCFSNMRSVSCWPNSAASWAAVAWMWSSTLISFLSSKLSRKNCSISVQPWAREGWQNDPSEVIWSEWVSEFLTSCNV